VPDRLPLGPQQLLEEAAGGDAQIREPDVALGQASEVRKPLAHVRAHLRVDAAPLKENGGVLVHRENRDSSRNCRSLAGRSFTLP
jgi:hypothetical protein